MKKNYGIDMQGPFRIQRVASLPAWTSDDLGREVYLTSNNKRYCGNNSAWIESDIDKIWTYQDTAPTGWSIIAGTTDALLACKGGSNAYNTSGGAQAGTWIQPPHSHDISKSPSGATNWQSSGGMVGSLGGTGSNDYATTYVGGGSLRPNHWWDWTTSNATVNTYRPSANVGIVIERN